MPLPDTNYSTLAQITTKVRKLTQSLSQDQIADQTIYDYINTFVLYDFPEHLRLFNLRTKLSFYAQPFIDVYDTTKITTPTDPLYNFLNNYITAHPPLFVAGYQALFSQSQEQFFAIYPKLQQISNIGIGDGVTTNFQGVVPSANPLGFPPPPTLTQIQPFLQNQVLFGSTDINYNAATLIDSPINSSTGNLIVPNASAPTYGTINYITGAYNITFPVAPLAGANVNVSVVQYQPARPQAMLFYAGVFTLRPVPDQPYQINFEVYQRPTALLASGDVPNLSEWWQYIAYGAAKKLFEDRMDMDSVQMIMPEFKMQERLILRRTIVQNTNNRTPTIYTEQNASTSLGWGNNATGLI